MKLIVKIAAVALSLCAAFYLILKYWNEISQFFGDLRDKIVQRCTRSTGSRSFAEEFDEVHE